MPEINTDDWMTTAEAAQVVRRSPTTILRWISQGRLRAQQPLESGGYLIHRAELERLLSRGGRRA